MNRVVVIALLAFAACAEEFRYDTRGLAGLYLVAGGNTATAPDFSPRRLDSAVSNVTAYSDNAAYFAARLDQVIRTPTTVQFGSDSVWSNGFTVALWARVENVFSGTAATTCYTVVSQYDTSGGADGLQIGLEFRSSINTNAVQVLRGGNAGETLVMHLPQPGFHDRRWHHIAVVQTSNATRLYFDGLLARQSNVTLTAGGSRGSHRVSIGGRTELGSGNGPHSGWLADVAMWTRTLSADEITHIYTETRR